MARKIPWLATIPLPILLVVLLFLPPDSQPVPSVAAAASTCRAPTGPILGGIFSTPLSQILFISAGAAILILVAITAAMSLKKFRHGGKVVIILLVTVLGLALSPYGAAHPRLDMNDPNSARHVGVGNGLEATSRVSVRSIPETPSSGPTPEIVFPSNGTLIAGTTALIANETNPAFPVQSTQQLWECSLDLARWFSIPYNPLAPDSRGLDVASTDFDTSALPPGPVYVRVTLSASGLSGSSVARLIVDKLPLIGTVFARYDPSTLLTTLSTSSYDPDDYITHFDWKLGDGSSASGQTVQHLYAANETYVISLNVTDSRGFSVFIIVTYGFFPPTSPPPMTPVFLAQPDACDPLSVVIAPGGNSIHKWTGDPTDGIIVDPQGHQPLGPLHNSEVIIAFNFEVNVNVIGDPPRCTEGQLIKTTRTVQLKDGTNLVRKNPPDVAGPPPNPGGFAGTDFHSDGYDKTGTWKKHLGSEVSWVDDPRMYTNTDPGNGFDQVINPIVKAKVQFVAIDFISGNEAPWDHTESEGTGETAWIRFQACASYDGTAAAGSQISSSFAVIDNGQPDSQLPAITNRGDTTPGSWTAGGAWASC